MGDSERKWRVTPVLCLVQLWGNGYKIASVAIVLAAMMAFTFKLLGDFGDPFTLGMVLTPAALGVIGYCFALHKAFHAVGILSRAVFVHATLEDIRSIEGHESRRSGSVQKVTIQYRVVVSLRDDAGNEWSSVQVVDMPEDDRFGDALAAVHDSRDRDRVLLLKYTTGQPKFEADGTVRAGSAAAVLGSMLLGVASVACLIAALLWPGLKP